MALKRRAPLQANQPLQVESFIAGRNRVQNEKGVQCSGVCDYNSIMMYSEWRDISLEAVRSSKATGRNLYQTDVLLQLQDGGKEVRGLSAIDRQVVRGLYYRGQPPYRSN